ncbi:MAG: hypothetical protein J6O04_09700 [Selenomonadaceae bacterium]|nr:hypothetical protein [Selenomonadaceae bacterium]
MVENGKMSREACEREILAYAKIIKNIYHQYCPNGHALQITFIPSTDGCDAGDWKTDEIHIKNNLYCSGKAEKGKPIACKYSIPQKPKTAKALFEIEYGEGSWEKEGNSDGSYEILNANPLYIF